MGYNSMYYTIGQVSKIAGLPQSVLRYWETVFKALNPPKSDGGTRQYTENNVEIILEIKKLLYDEGYTIKGANKHIIAKYSIPTESIELKSEEQNKNHSYKKTSESNVDIATLEHIIQKIHLIIELLDE